jgi:hypothetical protein
MIASIVATVDIIALIAAATTAIIAQIPETHALFARNQTIVPRSIHQRNKMLRRLDLGLGTSISLALRPGAPVTLISTLLVHTYSMWPESRAKTI